MIFFALMVNHRVTRPQRGHDQWTDLPSWSMWPPQPPHQHIRSRLSQIIPLRLYSSSFHALSVSARISAVMSISSLLGIMQRT